MYATLPWAKGLGFKVCGFGFKDLELRVEQSRWEVRFVSCSLVRVYRVPLGFFHS